MFNVQRRCCNLPRVAFGSSHFDERRTSVGRYSVGRCAAKLVWKEGALGKYSHLRLPGSNGFAVPSSQGDARDKPKDRVVRAFFKEFPLVPLASSAVPVG